jgi:hypothetical protein
VTGLDLRELELRVQTALGAAGARRLLEAWGAASEAPASTDAARLARQLVHTGRARFGDAELVRVLREAHPLVEWPEPSEPSSTNAGAYVEGPTLSGRTTTAETEATTQDPPRVLPGLDLPKVPSPTHTPPMPLDAPPRSFRELDPLGAAASGALDQPRSTPRSVWIAIGSVAAFVLLVGAVALGVVLGRAGDATASAQDGSNPPRPLAGRALAALEGGLAEVRRACEIDEDRASAVELLGLALEGCGRSERERARSLGLPVAPPGRRTREPSSPSPDASSSAERPSSAPRPEGAASPPRDAAAPTRRPDGSSTCTGACGRERDACDRACGAEPNDASAYEAIQSCRARCVAAESRCRRSCG